MLDHYMEFKMEKCSKKPFCELLINKTKEN